MIKLSDRFNSYINKKRTSRLTCVIAGVLGSLPYFCEELFIFTFISLILFFTVLFTRKKETRKTFSLFFSYFIGLYFPLYFFLSELYPYERFGFSETQAVFIVICSCILIPLLHAFVEAAVMCISKFFPEDAVYFVGYSALWVIGEWVLSLGNMAFPWGNTSVSLTGFLPYLQTISLFGKYFITFITVAICSLIAYAIVNKIRFTAYVAVIIFVLNTISGTVLYYIPTEKGNEIKVAAIQGNALSNEKWNSSHSGSIFDRYISMTEDAAKNGAKIILLPESAFPQIFHEGGSIHKNLSRISTEYSVTIVSGVRYYNNGDEWNSCVAILPDGTLTERYDKRHLVPFGEFIPFADTLGKLIPFVAEFNETSSEFIEGNEAILLGTEYGKITPLVCFDSIFTDFAYEGVANGAELIAVVTNDSWFNDSNGIYTHLRHSQIRAIENRRYVMRAANTGVSAFIDEKGKILEQSEPLTVDIVYLSVNPISSRPFYHIFGDFVLYLSFGLIVILIGFNCIKKNNP